MRKGNLYAPGKHIGSQGAVDAFAEPVSQSNPMASAEMIPSDRPGAGELNENAQMESTKLNAQGSIFLRNFIHEWLEFVAKRTRQHMHLIKVIQGCRSLPDLQQAYSEFWQNAFTQYAEEPRRMLLVTQGAVDGIPRRAWEWRNASHIALGGLPRHASTLTQPRQGNTKANRDLILNGTQMTQLFCTSGG